MQSCEPSSDNHVAARGMTCASEIAAERFNLDGGKGRLGSRLRSSPRGHSNPEDPPADDRDEGEQLHQPLGGLQSCILCAASRFHDLVEDLDFPTQGVPVEFFDGGGEIADRQVGRELPVDQVSIRRRGGFVAVPPWLTGSSAAMASALVAASRRRIMLIVRFARRQNFN